MSKKVLIVDDDPEFVETCEIILRAHGYETLSANNGEEAFKILNNEIPDIILLDIMMKTKGEGLWVSEKLKADENFCGIPILMITAVNQDADMSRFHIDPSIDREYLPVEGFLQKPIEPDELVQEIERVIGDKV
jgi:two-component system alkaline phosphatase synthesis response regulator PhoP